MNVRDVCKWSVVGALVALGSIVGLNEALFAQPGPADFEEGVQVLTRGPVHEGFAETVTFDPVPGIVVSASPPPAIEELPPDQRPEGDNVEWIPGYWAWDDERSDFLWVSGVWRALPPGRQWVPGYWGQYDEGFQWTSGYWADAQVTTTAYLSEPPATVEVGPNIPASSVDQNWLPGCWVWHQNRYAWRPGFWAAAQPDWIWVPAHYVCAPRGYVFVEGYWDYSIGRRGVLFAPVYFSANVYARRGFYYSPRTAIDLGVFANHLFLRPRYQHYYFGDYYAADYQAAGFYASYSVNSGRHGYDPIYAHQRWQYRQDPQWERRVAADFQNRRDHQAARPPRTWAAQRELGPSGAMSRDSSLVMATPLDQLTKRNDSPLRFRAVDTQERQKLAHQSREVQRLRQERHKLETQTPTTVRLPRSPIAAKPLADLGRDHTPPQAYPAPKPDSKVEPRPRVIRRAEPVARPPQPQPKATQPAPQPQPQPKVTQPPPRQPQPQPKVTQPAPRPQPQPKAERPAPRPQPQPKAERPAPRPQPQPKVTQPAPRPKPQPKAERPVPIPQPQPKAERPAPRPQPQPKAERPAPKPRGNAPAGPAPEEPTDDKHKGKNRD